MTSSIVLAAGLPLVAMALAASVAGLAFCRRPARGATSLAALATAVAFWTFGAVMALLAPDPTGTLFWTRLKWFGVALVPPLWLIFTLRYAGYADRLGPAALGVLALEPTILTTLVWTSADHALVWVNIAWITVGPFTTFTSSYGPVFWGHAIYSYMLLAAGVLIGLRVLRQSPEYRHRHIWAFLVAAIVPWAGNAALLAGIWPVRSIGPTPIAFAGSGVVLFWAFFRHRLLDPRSVALERVFETADMGVLLLDTQHTVVDLNPAAAAMLGRDRAAIVGSSLEEALGSNADVFAPADDRAYRDEITLVVEGEPRVLDLHLSSFYYQQQDLMGRIAYLRPTEDDAPGTSDTLPAAGG